MYHCEGVACLLMFASETNASLLPQSLCASLIFNSSVNIYVESGFSFRFTSFILLYIHTHTANVF